MPRNIQSYIFEAVVQRKFFIEAVFSLNENAKHVIYFLKKCKKIVFDFFCSVLKKVMESLGF